ncbi:MAG: integrase [Mesorhizobium sp.]|uniref:tyrosine-type recombinase/integrase n=1 Tax=Mesorhizobium sp. TaxID=1871066 RepID=UPI000FEAAD02|nr:tyrosine-type recombinase/integrase [Mesorhizobium sp.]RWL83974.1 MAG: integrase [Mesorhizobium sp.]TIP38048.1 MAG: integrase [Mesorhizobium sp.]TJV67350.1 MAG: integrase [Mesorhizobium sp.]
MPKIVQKNSVSSRLQAGMASDYVNGFSQWLHQRQYTPLTIREWLRQLACWTNWARENGYPSIDAVREAHAASFALVKAGYQRRFRGDLNKEAVEIAKLFIKYLEERGVLKRPPAKALAPIVAEFIAWARDHRGLAETTLARYQWTVACFVEALGIDPAAYNANAIRSYMMERAKVVSVDRVKSIAAVIRAYLRFLIATGRCPRGLDYALPKIASRALTSIPRFLRETDINRIIDACDGEDRLRDRAIILLLARLGLRASEIARLTFDDINWRQGSIRVFRKSRREELLPLSQELGDALLAYVRRTRPKLATPAIFLTEFAPIRPISRIAIKCLVCRALDRAGVESAARGAHILRHSAATSMLRHGVSLADVGTVLGHRSTAVTPLYAKVDMMLLSSIAQPWPESLPC